MIYLIIPAAAFFTSVLTLFSGFGLGTLLMPVFAVFFPLNMAVALTAIVHFLNNLFKLALLGRHADRPTVIHFGLPAMIASFAGAQTLIWLSRLKPLLQYELFGYGHAITPVKIAIGILMLFFAFIEIAPRLKNLTFQRKHYLAGGLMSGFFGGLSGHQGAFRSLFLIKSGFSKETFLGTGIVIACLVDISRLFVYSGHFTQTPPQGNLLLLVLSTLAAFLGAWLGSQWIHKITVKAIQILIFILLMIIALGLGTGLI